MRASKITRKIIISTLLMLMFFSFAYAETVTNEVASVFLESYNQLDGIELVGGPFKQSEYNVRRQNDTNEFDELLILDYKYIEKEGMTGWPSDFSVWLHNGAHFLLPTSSGPVLVSGVAEKELAKHGIRIDDLPSLQNSLMHDPPKSIVQISPDGNVLRKNGNFPSVDRVTEFKENSVFVFYNETYNSSLFRSLLSGHCSFSYRLGKDSKWNVVGVSEGAKYAPVSTTDYFLLFGDIEDDYLSSLVKKHRLIHPEFNILAIQITPDNQALLYEGDFEAVTKWLKNMPKAVAVFEKKENWQVSKTIQIFNADPYCVDIPVQIFPLTPKLSNDQLSEIRKNIKIDTKLSEAEILGLIHYAYRLRGISNNILSIKDIGTMEVEIRVGSFTLGSGVKFKKVNNKWLISGYYEYIS